MLRSRSHLLLLPFAILLTAIAIGGCGGGSDSLAQIEGTSATITKPMLNHWMRAMAGGDFRTNIGTKAPAGLVSEPANYPECEAAARKIVPRSYTGQMKLSSAQISQKCRELHHAIKAQALSFLISVAWTVAEGEEFGLKVSEAELHKEFARFRTQPYPTAADLKRYLSEHRWELSDILYQLKRNILVRRILPKFEAKVKRAGGGEAVYAKLALERYKRLIARTSCKPGYLAPGCKQYHGPESVSPAPNVILEQFVQGVTS